MGVVVGVVVGGTGVAVGGTGVAVGGTGVAVGGTGVAVGGTGVAAGGTEVAAGGVTRRIGPNGRFNKTNITPAPSSKPTIATPAIQITIRELFMWTLLLPNDQTQTLSF